MKTKETFVLFAVLSCPVLGQAGGPLTPPAGPPGQTMKSLDQMEPRTPLIAGAPGISVAPGGTITISQSGSYYLTGNLTVVKGDGIHISANGVSLDLRGFTITSSAANSTGSGVYINGSQVTVFNGHIMSGTTYNSGAAGDQFTGPGFDNGIVALSISHRNIHAYNLSVTGCDVRGISFFSEESLAESCTVRTTGGIGIDAGSVRDCSASECGGIGITGGTVHNSLGESNDDDGIFAETVSNCYGGATSTSNFAHGISAKTVLNSHGTSETGIGILSTTVGNSFGASSGGDGINGRSVNNSYGSTLGGLFIDDGIESSGTINNSYGYCGNPSGGNGIIGDLVNNSYGQTFGMDGISGFKVNNSCGESSGGTTSSHGIDAVYTVMNSYGVNRNSAGGDGIKSVLVSYSYGQSSGTDPSSDGIQATRAIGCFVGGGGENIGTKYLMP